MAAGISTVNPLLVIGGATAIFDSMLNPTINAWRNQWFEDLQEDYKRLEQKIENFNFEQKLKEPKIASVIIVTTLSAIKTDSDEKRKLLRNAVLNISIGTKLEDDVERIFLRLIDDLTPTHVRILKILAEPEEVIKQIIHDQQYQLNNFNIPSAYNDFYLRLPQNTFEYLINDLKSNNLIVTSGAHSVGLTTFSSSSAPSSSSFNPQEMAIQNIASNTKEFMTSFGLQFLQIIKEP